MLTKKFLSQPQLTEKHHLLPLAKKQAKQHYPNKGMVSRGRCEELGTFTVNGAEILYFIIWTEK